MHVNCCAKQSTADVPSGILARETGMSRFHFSRLFKAVFGETPKQCQLAARLELAKHLLMTTDSSVTDISIP
jgi:AraC family transcriptional regulator